MFDRMILWSYNQNPLFWEAVSLSTLSLFINVILGVN